MSRCSVLGVVRPGGGPVVEGAGLGATMQDAGKAVDAVGAGWRCEELEGFPPAGFLVSDAALFRSNHSGSSSLGCGS